ncbi:sigma-70 family RNA polymerase sigma factor [Limisphaera ngatamarikiensis]|uniref:Sigma-70 family RNA polymerase sigma factor n=1 Tax=Limisphaera ngatamarikiensis TaxID=1324935 RepID=A0A6M1RS40_9BACT|nr:sigma-70 family RNA polymerase sigma factor [Limisphaera ngatamarikiensis]NGO40349.1 sigma-70 family RNA polymerase sigma factor [Limisphaera ngatamarikiensis]
MQDERDLSSKPDEALVAAAKDGDLGAFEELVARHRDKVYARALSILRNEEDALDLSQEAWIKAWQRLQQFQGESSFATWITRIVINLCLDHLRRQKRAVGESLEAIEEEVGNIERLLPPVSINPAAGLERDELRARIWEAMGRLSVAHRTVLILHEFEGMEYRKIAEVMGCSLGTVMSRLFYARRRLAALLADLNSRSDSAKDA